VITVHCWLVFQGRRTDDTFTGLIDPDDPGGTVEYLQGRLRLAIRSHGMTPEQGARDYALDVNNGTEPTWTVRLNPPATEQETAS
jgi:hypothetical protein